MQKFICGSLVGVGLILGAACTSGGEYAGGSLAPPPRLDMVGNSMDFTIVPETREARSAIAAPRATVWQAVQAAYGELGVPIEMINQPGWTLGNAGFSVTRTLGGRQLSAYLSCGSTMVGPRADHDRIQLSIVSTLDEAEGGTLLRTAVAATARSVQGANTNPVPCSSNGQIERRLAALVAQAATP